MSYVYIRSEPSLWTVGFYDPSGKWQPDSDHESPVSAATRVRYLNGGWDGHNNVILLKELAGWTLTHATCAQAAGAEAQVVLALQTIAQAIYVLAGVTPGNVPGG